jgi:hypothetical protein
MLPEYFDKRTMNGNHTNTVTKGNAKMRMLEDEKDPYEDLLHGG